MLYLCLDLSPLTLDHSSGGYDVAAIACAFVLPVVSNPSNVKCNFLMGSLVTGMAGFSFAFTELITNLWLFNFTCLLIRHCQKLAINVIKSDSFVDSVVLFVMLFLNSKQELLSLQKQVMLFLSKSVRSYLVDGKNTSASNRTFDFVFFLALYTVFAFLLL